MIDLNDLAYKVRNVAHARKKNGANIDTDTFKMLKHCATEVVEATDAWSTMKMYQQAPDLYIRDKMKPEELEADFASELADVILCVLIICANEPTIDIEKALQKGFEKNLARAEGRGDKK